MSERAAPFAAVFDAQRRLVEGNREAVHWGLDVATQAADAAVESASSGEAVQHAGSNATRTAVLATVDATTAMVPGSETGARPLRDALDDGFDAAETVNEQTWDALRDVWTENARALEEVTEMYRDVTDATAEDTLEVIARLEEQTGTWTPE